MGQAQQKPGSRQVCPPLSLCIWKGSRSVDWMLDPPGLRSPGRSGTISQWINQSTRHLSPSERLTNKVQSSAPPYFSIVPVPQYQAHACYLICMTILTEMTSLSPQKGELRQWEAVTCPRLSSVLQWLPGELSSFINASPSQHLVLPFRSKIFHLVLIVCQALCQGAGVK